MEEGSYYLRLSESGGSRVRFQRTSVGIESWHVPSLKTLKINVKSIQLGPVSVVYTVLSSLLITNLLSTDKPMSLLESSGDSLPPYRKWRTTNRRHFDHWRRDLPRTWVPFGPLDVGNLWTLPGSTGLRRFLNVEVLHRESPNPFSLGETRWGRRERGCVYIRVEGLFRQHS